MKAHTFVIPSDGSIAFWIVRYLDRWTERPINAEKVTAYTTPALHDHVHAALREWCHGNFVVVCNESFAANQVRVEVSSD